MYTSAGLYCTYLFYGGYTIHHNPYNSTLYDKKRLANRALFAFSKWV